MALTLKCLFTGSSLSTTANTPRYGPGIGKSAIISTIIVTNKTSSSTTLKLGLRRSNNSSWPLNTVTVNANSRLVLKDQITLQYLNSTGDKLEIWAGAASSLDVVVCGVERDY